MTISVFGLFKVGIGPSSSHTVGPMKAAYSFAENLYSNNQIKEIHSIKVELYGSLAATGKGHGSDKAVMLGLEGELPERIEVDDIEERVKRIIEPGICCNVTMLVFSQVKSVINLCSSKH